MEDQNQLTFIIDVDGTLCPIRHGEQKYEELVPFAEMVDKLRELKKSGARVILNTSRNMKSYGGNIGLINVKTAPVLLNWLEKWDIPYDEIIFGKPWPGPEGFYVDDRSIRPREFLEMSEEELTAICDRDRCAEK